MRKHVLVLTLVAGCVCVGCSCDRPSPPGGPADEKLTDQDRSALWEKQLPLPLATEQLSSDLQKLKVQVDRLGGEFMMEPEGKSGYQMVRVDLGGRPATDADLAELQSVERITHLMLQGSQVTDAGLVHLQGARRLVVLDVSGTAVGDQGLQHLLDLPKLTLVRTHNSKVTAEGARALSLKLEANYQRGRKTK